jgi:hypothetical protein
MRSLYAEICDTGLNPSDSGDGQTMDKPVEISWFARNLSSGERLGELLFGLIMTLTFTLTAGLAVGDGPDAVRELLIATIGCNIAWGIIDGGLLVIGNTFDRGRLARLGQSIRESGRLDESAAIVAEELGDTLDPLVAPERRETLYREIAEHVRSKAPERSGVRASDWLGALVMFVAVFFHQPASGAAIPVHRRTVAGAAGVQRCPAGTAVHDRLPLGGIHNDQPLAGRLRHVAVRQRAGGGRDCPGRLI